MLRAGNCKKKHQANLMSYKVLISGTKAAPHIPGPWASSNADVFYSYSLGGLGKSGLGGLGGFEFEV